MTWCRLIRLSSTSFFVDDQCDGNLNIYHKGEMRGGLDIGTFCQWAELFVSIVVDRLVDGNNVATTPSTSIAGEPARWQNRVTAAAGGAAVFDRSPVLVCCRRPSERPPPGCHQGSGEALRVTALQLAAQPRPPCGTNSLLRRPSARRNFGGGALRTPSKHHGIANVGVVRRTFPRARPLALTTASYYPSATRCLCVASPPTSTDQSTPASPKSASRCRGALA